jgi:hypothetical protein
VDFGKLGNRARPEDTELCLRMSQASGGQWMYVPHAVIDHPVPLQRQTFRYFLDRCYHEGRGKVAMARLLRGHEQRLSSESEYLRSTLPRTFVRSLVDAGRGRGASHLAQAGALVSAVAAAGLGAVAELMDLRDSAHPRALRQLESAL